MPMQKDRYPANWNAISLRIRERDGWVCQRCGMQCRRPGEPFDTHKRTMSVMHLNHDPSDCRDENLQPACSKCHLQYDAPHHAQNAAKTRRAKKIASGQMELL